VTVVMGAPVIVTPPSVEPILLADAKAHLRVLDTSEDALITALISVARQYVENNTRRALITQTFDVFLDDFPPADGSESQLRTMQSLTGVDWPRFSTIEIPRPPLQSVTYIKYMDQATRTMVTLAPTEYIVDTASERGRIQPGYGKFWPIPLGVMNAVNIRFVAGYGTADTDITSKAAGLRAAMLLLIGAWYQYREAIVDANVRELPVPIAVPAILAQYESWRAA
jgi:uncharacterized phiE125 gp8 family phage protein